MVHQDTTLPAFWRLPVTGLLAWILPGLGHVYIGERKRGLIILVTIAVTFWGGVAIGGVRHTVNPQTKRLWFLAQITAGSHTVVAHLFGVLSRRGLESEEIATNHWQSAELATVYTGVAGLLNVLVILDALGRAERRDFRERAPARASRA